AQAAYKAVWSPLTPSVNSFGIVDCGWYTARLQLTQGSATVWTGSFNVHYSRTWFEGNAAQPLQVWRYLVNGDMRPATTTAGPCALPPCAPASASKIHFTG